MDYLLSFIEPAAAILELAGVAAVMIGALVSTVRYFLWLRRGFGEAYNQFRMQLARSILLGLEFLVAADIVRTVAIHPSLENVAVLGLIVLIRTFLSFSLEMEVSGRWPWQRA